MPKGKRAALGHKQSFIQQLRRHVAASSLRASLPPWPAQEWTRELDKAHVLRAVTGDRPLRASSVA
jgi:hypothetical protein